MAQFITFLHPLSSPVSCCRKVFLQGEIVRRPAISVSLTFLITIFFIPLNGLFLTASIAEALL